MTPEPDRTQSLSVRGLLAALAVLFGSLHLIVADSRGADWLVEGIVLMVIGLASVTIAVTLLLTAARWPVQALGALGLVSVVGIIWTRLVGYPFGPFADYSPRLTPFDVVVMITALVISALAVATLTVGLEHIGAHGARFDTIAPIVIAMAAVFGVSLTSWTEEAAYIAGASHSHGVATTASPSNGSSILPGVVSADSLYAGDRVRLGQQMDLARTTAAKFPTLSDARTAGWIPIGDFVPGAGQMLVDPAVAVQTRTFDPAAPSALLFASSADDAPVIGVQYDLWGEEAPEGFIGQRRLWHLHGGTCEISSASGSFAVVYDPAVTGTACRNIDGQLTNTIAWMIRAWVIPGWENPGGPFAHDHSLLAQPQ
ncbi:MAG: hypothetical protein ACO3SP_03800 [Ilumatobacteraceae bacterium]